MSETCDSSVQLDFDTIYCQLPKGHEGKHVHEGIDIDQNISYKVTWETTNK
jgi:hypothetical protein